jgi:hypothetical protein
MTRWNRVQQNTPRCAVMVSFVRARSHALCFLLAFAAAQRAVTERLIGDSFFANAGG